MKGTIQVNNLSKTFKKGNVKAVKEVSFEVQEGEFFAFLGPNGAGKSTVVQMLTTILQPSDGEGKVAGYDIIHEPHLVRRNIGVALQETGIDPGLTGREMLVLQARIFGFSKKDAKNRAEELLEIVDLTEDADRQCGDYSGGMRRRLDLALTLINEPKILFLDEPTNGLDPSNRKSIWEELKRLNKENGTTIFLTTQYLEEADYLADRISIINHGEIVASGTPAELKAQIGNDLITLNFETEDAAKQAQASIMKEVDADVIIKDLTLNVYVQKGTKRLLELVRILDQNSITAESVNLKTPTLDDIFLKITSNESNSEKKGVLHHG